MDASPTWAVLLLAGTALHAGFQATVTLLVYPALARVPAADWSAGHDAHSRGITPLVVVVYGAALVTCVGAVLSDPGRVGVWVAVLGTALAFGVTAVSAAPTHGRLGSGHDLVLIDRLLRVDRLRLLGALVALAGALLAVLTR